MLRLTHPADLGVLYAADRQRYLQGLAVPGGRMPTCEEFQACYAGCPSVGFERDGQAIGGILFDGEQAHIAVLPEHHGHWALLLKPALQWLFALQRDMLVHVEAANPVCLRFMQRSGWERVGVRGDDIVFRLRPQAGQRKTEYPYPARARATLQRAAASTSITLRT
jgi:GNAT superfamily N-acetyltransferase